MHSPNIHRVRLIEERDHIKTQFEEYKLKVQRQLNMYRIALLGLAILVCLLCLLGGHYR